MSYPIAAFCDCCTVSVSFLQYLYTTPLLFHLQSLEAAEDLTLQSPATAHSPPHSLYQSEETVRPIHLQLPATSTNCTPYHSKL